MTDILLLPPNPYVSIKDQIVGITSGKKKYRFPIERILKMYVSKRKSGQITDFLGSLLHLTSDNTYHLCIQTNDGNETKIRISSLQRYYVIRLISLIRRKRIADQLAVA